MLRPGTMVETQCPLNEGLRDSFPHQQAAAILTYSEVAVTVSKETLLCGILVWDKNWKDGNRCTGGKRIPEDTLIFLPLWKEGALELGNFSTFFCEVGMHVCVHARGGNKVTRKAQRQEEISDSRKLKESRKNNLIIGWNRTVKSIFNQSHLIGSR